MGFSALRHSKSYAPEYLYQTQSNLFIFRMKVPLDCRPLLKKKEIRYSLKTRCVYSARGHLASILPFLSGIFAEIRQGAYTNHSSLQTHLNSTIKEGIHQAITGKFLPREDGSTSHEPTVTALAPAGPVFSDLQEAFFKEKELSQEWRLKTQEDITHLKHKQVDPFMIHELDGHTIESETMGRYGKRYTPEILLREAIEKIDYGLTYTQP